MLAFGTGILIGYKVFPPILVGIGYIVLLVLLCIIKCLQKNIEGLFTLMPYAMYTEIFVRKRATWQPYLTMQYFYIIAFGLLLIIGVQEVENPTLLDMESYLIFTIVEVMNNVYPNKGS